MKYNYRNLLLSMALLWVGADFGAPAPKRSLSPSPEVIAETQAAFLALPRPLGYKHVLDRPASNLAISSLDAESHIELFGGARTFVDGTPAQDLIYALWPFLTNQTYDAEAFILLQGKLAPKMASDLMLTYQEAKRPGTWPSYRAHLVERCQRLCRSALNQPEWWYPHPVLFDRGQVLAESRTNAVLRAAHIAAMVKTLDDPKIRADNPLEVKNI